jgi:hypothetical protein
MANLDNLGIPSISDMTIDEGIEHLRLIRLNRRAPTKPPITKTKKVDTKPKLDMSKLSEEEKNDLLKILTGE